MDVKKRYKISLIKWKWIHAMMKKGDWGFALLAVGEACAFCKHIIKKGHFSPSYCDNYCFKICGIDPHICGTDESLVAMIFDLIDLGHTHKYLRYTAEIISALKKNINK